MPAQIALMVKVASAEDDDPIEIAYDFKQAGSNAETVVALAGMQLGLARLTQSLVVRVREIHPEVTMNEILDRISQVAHELAEGKTIPLHETTTTEDEPQEEGDA